MLRKIYPWKNNCRYLLNTIPADRGSTLRPEETPSDYEYKPEPEPLRRRRRRGTAPLIINHNTRWLENICTLRTSYNRAWTHKLPSLLNRPRYFSRGCKGKTTRGVRFGALLSITTSVSWFFTVVLAVFNSPPKHVSHPTGPSSHYPWNSINLHFVSTQQSA